MSYTRNARILSLGIATTGLVTFAYFSLASHALTKEEYGGISLLWSVMFVILSTIYRPIEQLLSRTIAQRRAQGLHTDHPLRVPFLLQGGFACLFLVVALSLRDLIQEDLFNGSQALYIVLVAGTVAYAASYAARGWLAGHEQFGLYGGLVLLESCSRCLFALAAVIGIAHGQTVVALGIFAAPLVSLFVVPPSLRRKRNYTTQPTQKKTQKESSHQLSLQHGARFAVAVFITMLAEQTLINGAVLTTFAREGETALAGMVFNLFLITRAPLQLFQAIQGSLLPHLTGLTAKSDHDAVHRAVRGTLRAIGIFALLVAIAMALCGPFAMNILFPSEADSTYQRLTLVVIALGMGTHLIAGTLTQATIARHRETACALAWLFAALSFLVWMIVTPIADVMLRASSGYLIATSLLAVLLITLLERSKSV